MLLAPLLLLLTAPEPALGPLIPAGSSAEFQNAVVAVEAKLYASDFAGAAKLAKALPGRSITVHWDDSKVPTPLRAEFAARRDRALKTWSSASETTISLAAKSSDIKFGFEPVLANPPGSGVPAGAALFWTEDLTSPRLETVIGLKRGLPPEPINAVNVENEVAHAIGAYFGIATSPFPGTYMGRTDVNYQTPSMLTPAEVLLAKNNLKVVDAIRAAIKAKKRLTPTRPKLFLDPKKVDLGTILQGDPARFELQMTNSGNAPLAIRMVPDCGCLTFDRYQVIQPGSTYIWKGNYDSMITVGQIHHMLLLNTNDSDSTTQMLPVEIRVKPRFRFLIPAGDVVQVPETGTEFTAYILVSAGTELPVTQAQIAGIPGTASVEPWSGKLADPEMGEGELPRKGYKVKVHLTGDIPVPGRAPVTLWASTTDVRFPSVQVTFFAQRGIVAVPFQLYLGELGADVRKFSFLVSGPANTFHIKRVTSNLPFLSFEVFPSQEGTDIRVQATYNGSAPIGAIEGKIVVETDNPKQPKIEVPARGSRR